MLSMGVVLAQETFSKSMIDFPIELQSYFEQTFLELDWITIAVPRVALLMKVLTVHMTYGRTNAIGVVINNFVVSAFVNPRWSVETESNQVH